MKDALNFLICMFIAGIMLLITGYAKQANAQVNLNFTSSGLTGWTMNGGSVVSSMTNFSDGPYTWNIYPYTGNYMAKLQPTSSATYSTMTSQFGLNASSLTSIQSFLNSHSGGGSTNPTNAAWMYYAGLNLTAGQSFTIAWNFVATDYTPWNDTSITTLVNTSGTGDATVNNVIGQYSVLGAINPGSGNYSTGSYGSTGWQLSTYKINATGTYTLGFGSFNLGDTAYSPILLVSGVQGTTYNGTTPVGPVAPNPGSTAPSASAPTVVSTSTSNTTSTSTAYGTPTTSTSYVQRQVNGYDAQGFQVTWTYIDTVTTTTTPKYTTTTTTPITTTTWSDGTTTTENGTPTSTTTTEYVTSSSTTYATAPTSTTPWLTGGGSSAAFSSNTGNDAKVISFIARTTADSKINIEQIGNANAITVEQIGSKNNYVSYKVNGSSNTANIVQTGNASTQSNYADITVTGNSNNLDVRQNSTGGAKGAFITVSNNNNIVKVQQNDSGNHYAEVNLSGGNKNVDILQTGSASHMASINMSGYAQNLTLQQNGSTQQFYSITSNCATAGGCSAIAVRQGQ